MGVKSALKAAAGAAKRAFNWARSKLITKAGVLAKRANQRLREIENQGLRTASGAYQYIKKKEFDKASWLAKVSKGPHEGEVKFNTNFRSMSDEQIIESINHIETFLNAQTSTTKGVKQRITNLTDKFNQKLEEFDTEKTYTEDEFTELMTTTNIQELFNDFDASDIMRLLASDKRYNQTNADGKLNADAILEALALSQNKKLAKFEWFEIQNAFEAWTESEDERIEKESQNYEPINWDEIL